MGHDRGGDRRPTAGSAPTCITCRGDLKGAVARRRSVTACAARGTPIPPAAGTTRVVPAAGKGSSHERRQDENQKPQTPAREDTCLPVG